MNTTAPGTDAPRRHCTRKSARASLVYGLATVAALHLGLLAVYSTNWINDPIYSHRANLLKKRVAAGSEKPEIVVAFGTSRIGEGFDAKQIEPLIEERMQCRGVAINFGFAGIGPLAEHIYLRRLLEEGIRPDLVVIEAYVLTLGDQKGIENFALTAERVSRRESHLLRHYGYPRDAVKRKRLEIVANPWGELRLPIMSRLYPQSIPPSVTSAHLQNGSQRLARNVGQRNYRADAARSHGLGDRAKSIDASKLDSGKKRGDSLARFGGILPLQRHGTGAGFHAGGAIVPLDVSSQC